MAWLGCNPRNKTSENASVSEAGGQRGGRSAANMGGRGQLARACRGQGWRSLPRARPEGGTAGLARRGQPEAWGCS